MRFVLVVVRPFDSYRAGDLVETPSTVQDILAGEHSKFVVRVAVTSYSGH